MANLIVQIIGAIAIIICGYMYGKLDQHFISMLCYGGGILWIYYNLQIFMVGKPKLKEVLRKIKWN